MDRIASSEQKFINLIDRIIKANIENEQFGVSELAKKIKMSRSNLHRRIKKITNTTATSYIKQIRLAAAMVMLEKVFYSVSEVAYETGFSSPSYFIKCFREFYGHTPGAFKKGINFNFGIEDEYKTSK